jgi:hypothetical protein
MENLDEKGNFYVTNHGHWGSDQGLDRNEFVVLGMSSIVVPF